MGQDLRCRAAHRRGSAELRRRRPVRPSAHRRSTGTGPVGHRLATPQRATDAGRWRPRRSPGRDGSRRDGAGGDPRRQSGPALRLRLIGNRRHSVACGPQQRCDRRPSHQRINPERREQCGTGLHLVNSSLGMDSRTADQTIEQRAVGVLHLVDEVAPQPARPDRPARRRAAPRSRRRRVPSSSRCATACASTPRQLAPRRPRPGRRAVEASPRSARRRHQSRAMGWPGLDPARGSSGRRRRTTTPGRPPASARRCLSAGALVERSATTAPAGVESKMSANTGQRRRHR